MENNQTNEAILEAVKKIEETVLELLNITKEREKRFAERGAARPQGDRGGDRGGFRPRNTDRGDSNWGNTSFNRGGRDDRNRNKG